MSAILVVKIGDVLIGNRDFCDDFTIQKLLDRELPPDVILQIICANAPILQLPLKFVFSVGSFEFGEFVLDLAVCGFHAKLPGTLDQNVIINELVQDVQRQRKRFFLRWCRRLRIQSALVIFFRFYAMYLLAVDDRPYVGPGWRVVLATGKGQRGKHKRRGVELSYHVKSLNRRCML